MRKIDILSIVCAVIVLIGAIISQVLVGEPLPTAISQWLIVISLVVSIILESTENYSK